MHCEMFNYGKYQGPVENPVDSQANAICESKRQESTSTLYSGSP